MRILVTGGAGYVGSVCAAELARNQHQVTVLDDLSTGFRDAVPAGADFAEIDLGDAHAVRRLLGERKFDTVFHFAAKALIAESVSNPAFFYRENVGKGLIFLEELRAAGITNFIFSSTAAVYGNPEQVPIDEDHPKHPVNSYGETKLAFERALRWYSTAYGWSVTAFRYFNASGASETHGERHDPETHIIPLVLDVAAGKREAFNIYGTDYATPDQTCLRDYVHVLDIANAHIAALRLHGLPGMRVFNIGTGTSYSVREVIRVAEEVTGRKVAVRETPRRPGDPAILCASPARLKGELHWSPAQSDLTHILRTAWKWHQQLHTRKLTAHAD